MNFQSHWGCAEGGRPPGHRGAGRVPAAEGGSAGGCGRERGHWEAGVRAQEVWAPRTSPAPLAPPPELGPRAAVDGHTPGTTRGSVTDGSVPVGKRRGAGRGSCDGLGWGACPPSRCLPVPNTTRAPNPQGEGSWANDAQTPTPHRGPVWAGTVPLQTESWREARPGASAGLSNLNHSLQLRARPSPCPRGGTHASWDNAIERVTPPSRFSDTNLYNNQKAFRALRGPAACSAEAAGDCHISHSHRLSLSPTSLGTQ